MGFLDSLFGTGPDPAEAAAEAEKKRKEEIAAAQRRIEGIFSSPSREKEILDFIGAQRGYLQSDLDRQHTKNRLQTKFATARSGLSGGSVDVDRNRTLAETYLRGIAEAERRAQNAGADLRSADQQSKQTLFNQILSGADVGTAATNAAQLMRINSQQAAQDSYVNAFQGLFGDFGDIYKQSREAAGERRASQDYGSLFGPRPRTQASGAGFGG